MPHPEQESAPRAEEGGRRRAGRCWVLVTVVMLVSRPAALAAQVLLGDTLIERDRIVVLLLLGHSNMGSALADSCPNKAPFEDAHPRIWNFSIADSCNPAPHHAWIPATAPVHVRNIIPEKTYGPAMPFLKAVLARLPEGYHVGVIQNAEGSARVRSHYLEGTTTTCKSNLRQQIEEAIRTLDTAVTWGGAVTMLGMCERTSESAAGSFAADMVELIERIRSLTRTPDLPFLVTQYEEGATGRYAIDKRYGREIARAIDSLPHLLSRIHVIPTHWSRDRERFMGDDHHFNCAGHIHWAHLAARALQRDSGLPMREIDLRPPTAPGVPRLDSASCTRARVSWEPAGDDVAVCGYEVVHSHAETLFVYSANVRMDSLPAGDSLTGAVRAVDFTGKTSPFVRFSFAPPDTCASSSAIPATPSSLRCTPRDSTTLSLAWAYGSPSPPSEGFAVYLSGSRIGSSTDKAYVLTGLRPATTYEIAVSALSGDGAESAPTPNVTCTTREPVPRDSVFRLTSPAVGDTLWIGTDTAIRWEADTIVGNADLYLSADSGKHWLVITANGTVTRSDAEWGAFPWRVPGRLEGIGLAGKACVLRIEDYERRFADRTGGYFMVMPSDDRLATVSSGAHTRAGQAARRVTLGMSAMHISGRGACTVRLLRPDGSTVWRARLNAPCTARTTVRSAGLYLLEIRQGRLGSVYRLLVPFARSDLFGSVPRP